MQENITVFAPQLASGLVVDPVLYQMASLMTRLEEEETIFFPRTEQEEDEEGQVENEQTDNLSSEDGAEDLTEEETSDLCFSEGVLEIVD